MKKFIVIILMSVFLISGCAQDEIEIGAILMLTGMASNFGENSQQGIQMAVEEINAAGGINGKQLKIVYEDNQGDNAAVAVTAFHRLLAEDIKIMIGPNWSPSGNALAPLACDRNVLMVSPSLGVATFNEKCDSLFNVWPHDFILSEVLGKHLYENGYRNIAILGSFQVWEQEQAEAVKKGFEKAGGEVSAYLLTSREERDFRPEALKIKNSNPDVVVFTNYGQQDLSAKRLREIGIDVPFYSVLIDQDNIDAANGALEGTIAVTSYTPTDAFSNKFKERYGEEIETPADGAYDAVMLIAEAMRETGSTDVSDLKDYLNALERYSGVSGELIFDDTGGVTKPFRFLEVKDGKMVSLKA